MLTGKNWGVRDNDGRKLDHKTLEVLRMRAVEQVAAGAHPEDVAVTMGLYKHTVYGWLAKVRGGGKDALKAKAIPGRPSKLGAHQISRLYALIVGVDPRQLSFGYALWWDWSQRTVIALVMQTEDNSLTMFPKRTRFGRIKLSSRQGHGVPNPTWIPAANDACERLPVRSTARHGAASARSSTSQ